MASAQLERQLCFLIFSTWRFPSPKLRCARISSRLPPRGQHQVARKPRYDDDSATPLVNQLPFSIPLNYSTGAKTNRDHVRTRAGRRGMAGLRTPGPSLAHWPKVRYAAPGVLDSADRARTKICRSHPQHLRLRALALVSPPATFESRRISL